MEKMTVDDLVRTRVLPEFQPIVAIIRELMKVCRAGCERIHQLRNTLFTKSNRILGGYQSNQKRHYLFLYARSQFEDKYNLLRGVGKHIQTRKDQNIAGANRDALRYYIQQALEFDSK